MDFFRPFTPTTCKGTIAERFADFHARNPQVYAHLVSLARELVALGHERIGIKMLWERLRWSYAERTTGDDYRLNNDFTALYARLIMAQETDLSGIFELRDRRAA